MLDSLRMWGRREPFEFDTGIASSVDLAAFDDPCGQLAASVARFGNSASRVAPIA
jgi:hypothetical protein